MSIRVAVTVAAAGFITFAPAASSAQAHAHPVRDTLGSVHFATSCSPAVAPTFDRAIALLHSFEFGASIRTFNEVLAADPSCAMAQWGIALSRWTNPMSPGVRPAALLRQGKEAADAAANLAAGARTSERERGYIAAVGRLYDDFERKPQPARIAEYERAMGELAQKYPGDTEAAIFHAIALVAAAPPTDKTYANQLRAGATLEPMWMQQPDHPGLAHYIIHTYDYPALADKAREAARRYAGIAPSAAHALHMPSHTFTRVGMWQESVGTNRRSLAAALSTGSPAEALHAADYAMYAYLQLGMEKEARGILDTLPALSAGFDPARITGAAPGSAGVFAINAIPARWVLERRAWREAAALVPVRSDFPYADAITYFARSLGSSRTGALAQARSDVDSLASFQRQLTSRSEPYWAEQVAIQHLIAQAWLDLAERRNDLALSRMREAVTREDATEKAAVTPGPLAPARELLGDMLVELGQPAEARAEYATTLRKEPGRRHSMRGAGQQAPPPGRAP
jgi:hypothetical protein